MERGLIPERLYNEFGKNLLHIVADAKDVNEVTAQTAEIIQDFMNRENIKVDDVIARELQLAENLRFETKEEQTIFDKYDLSGLDNKPSERKAVIKKVVEDEEQTPPALKDVESTAKVIEDGDKWYKAEKSVKDKDGNDITLTIDKNKDTNHFYIKAKDNKGNEIGSALFETDNGKVWSGNEIEVNEGNRRKGIMSEIYDFAESEGHPLEPTKSLSKEGKAFWENRKSQTLLSKEQTPAAAPNPQQGEVIQGNVAENQALRDVESTAKQELDADN